MNSQKGIEILKSHGEKSDSLSPFTVLASLWSADRKRLAAADDLLRRVQKWGLMKAWTPIDAEPRYKLIADIDAYLEGGESKGEPA